MATPITIPPMAAADPGDRLAATGITVHFGGVVALDDVTLTIPSGQARGLIGPNGAGKTTLFDVISGFRRPTQGRVLLDGRDITGLSAMQRSRRGMRRTFQRQQVFSWLSVRDNVLAALEWKGGGGGVLADLVAFPTRVRIERTRRSRAQQLLRTCGLADVAEETVGTLPIGRARLVELARALVDDPTVLLLDEPTSGMSPEECTQVAEIISDYRQQSGCTVVVVEHDLEFVMGLCQAVSVLEGGRLIFDGSPDEARADPNVRKAYIG